MFVQADVRNASADRFFNERSGAGSEPVFFADLAQCLYVCREVIRMAVNKGLCNFHRSLCSVHTGFCFHVGEHHVVNTFLPCFACSSETNLHSCHRLQLECHVLDHMTHPCSFFHAMEKSSRPAL